MKTSEAVGKLIVEVMKEEILGASLPVKMGGLLVKPALNSVRKLMNPSEEGAAPLLGVNGLMFIGHGRSDALAVQNAVRIAAQAARVGMLELIRGEMDRRGASQTKP
jgi:glycerol-3-phosphate acyltransferase PlsX